MRDPVKIRGYEGEDAQATQAVFLRAVRETARVHHTPAQVEAWADEGADLGGWARARAAIDTVVAVVDHQVVGFADLSDEGYVDMLFVDPVMGRRGIGSELLAYVIALAHRRGLSALTTYASPTSRPVFARLGFEVTGERVFGNGPGATTTYAMCRVLVPATTTRFADPAS